MLTGAAPGPGPSPSRAEAGRRFQKCPEVGYESLFFKCSPKKGEIIKVGFFVFGFFVFLVFFGVYFSPFKIRDAFSL